MLSRASTATTQAVEGRVVRKRRLVLKNWSRTMKGGCEEGTPPEAHVGYSNPGLGMTWLDDTPDAKQAGAPASGARQSGGTVLPSEKRREQHITVLIADERSIVGHGMTVLLETEKDITLLGQARNFAQLLEMTRRCKPSVVIVAISIALRSGLRNLRVMLQQECQAALLILIPHDNHTLWKHIYHSGVIGFVTEHSNSLLLASAIRIADTKRSLVPAPPNHGSASTSRSGVLLKVGLPLTDRELQVLRYIADGHTNKLMASKFLISIKTLEKHRQSLMDKLCIHDTATLTRYAMYAGVVPINVSAT